MSIASERLVEIRTQVQEHLDRDQSPKYDETDKSSLVNHIKTQLEVENAVLVAHYYTEPEIQALADETGGCVADSLEMARFGRDHPASTLVVAGVRFMGETAKILTPEKRVLMPTLAAMLVVLTLFVLTLDNAIIGIRYYLVPDFSRIELSVINGALSQAFFSLSLGMGILITYGSYFSREDNIAQSTRMVAIADTSIAFFAGLLILPAIFAFDPNTNTDDLSTSSIGLIFSFLPQIFLSMQAAVGYTGASVVAIVFFTLVFFAALTSLVSIIEIPISCWIDELKLSRKKAVGLQAFLLTLFAIPAVMSLGISDFFTNFTNYGGTTKSFFDLVSDVFYETILPFVGFTVCIFCVYRWKVSGLKSELVKGDESYDGSMLEKYINFSLGTVIPVVLLLVFISTVAQIYFA